MYPPEFSSRDLANENMGRLLRYIVPHFYLFQVECLMNVLCVVSECVTRPQPGHPVNVVFWSTYFFPPNCPALLYAGFSWQGVQANQWKGVFWSFHLACLPDHHGWSSLGLCVNAIIIRSGQEVKLERSHLETHIWARPSLCAPFVRPFLW